jgi:hypothetical protein
MSATATIIKPIEVNKTKIAANTVELVTFENIDINKMIPL